MTIRKLLRNLWFWFHERTYKKRLKYLYENNHSDRLIISFSGFPGNRKPSYNYVRTLRGIKEVDKLFILDDFGYKGSYYLMENGSDIPCRLVVGLIKEIVSREGYKFVYTMGSSKGGTAAIYFGLQCNVTAVYAGACQYYIGSYLNRPQYMPIVVGMTGREPSEDVIAELDKIVPKQLEVHAGSQTIVHLLYSKEEHTYKEHIADLINDLKNNNIPYTEKVEQFPNHDDVGDFFSPFVRTEITNELKN